MSLSRRVQCFCRKPSSNQFSNFALFVLIFWILRLPFASLFLFVSAVKRLQNRLQKLHLERRSPRMAKRPNWPWTFLQRLAQFCFDSLVPGGKRNSYMVKSQKVGWFTFEHTIQKRKSQSLWNFLQWFMSVSVSIMENFIHLTLLVIKLEQGTCSKMGQKPDKNWTFFVGIFSDENQNETNFGWCIFEVWVLEFPCN